MFKNQALFLPSGQRHRDGNLLRHSNRLELHTSGDHSVMNRVNLAGGMRLTLVYIWWYIMCIYMLAYVCKKARNVSFFCPVFKHCVDLSYSDMCAICFPKILP